MSKFTTEQRLSLFESELASIKNPEYRRFLEDVLAAADDYFFDMPASTTGKYHPTFALGEGGLVRHTRAVVFIARSIGEANIYDSEHLDMITVASVVHDIKKKGNDGSAFTSKDHPECAVKLLKEIYSQKPYGIPSDKFQEICDAVECHMGQWGTRKPSTRFEFALHSADYIASRKQLRYTLFDELASTDNRPETPEVPQTVMTVEGFVFPFGKYTGKTLNEVAKIDVGYLTWIANKSDYNNKEIQTLITEFLKKR